MSRLQLTWLTMGAVLLTLFACGDGEPDLPGPAKSCATTGYNACPMAGAENATSGGATTLLAATNGGAEAAGATNSLVGSGGNDTGGNGNGGNGTSESAAGSTALSEAGSGAAPLNEAGGGPIGAGGAGNASGSTSTQPGAGGSDNIGGSTSSLPSEAGAPNVTDLDAGVLDASVLPDAGTSSDAGPTGPVAVAVDTLASKLVRSGDLVPVTCMLADAQGHSFLASSATPIALQVTPSGAAQLNSDGNLVAILAGEFTVACSIASLGLTDATPAVVKVLPGAVARTVAHLDRNSISAGQAVTASCDVLDAVGNPVTDRQATLVSTPRDLLNTFVDAVGTFERAGQFAVGCDVAGAEMVTANLEVLADLPASLEVALVPDQATYSLNQVIELKRTVADRFGNPVTNATVTVTSDPAGTSAGDGKFVYSKAGQYRLTATVTSATEGNVALAKSKDLIVDATGPTINCDTPADGEILNQAPGGNLVFRGTVSDPSGVKELRVNGAAITPDASGHFTLPLTSNFGINYVDLSALDGKDRKTTRNCAFLVANRWAADGASLGDSLSLRLRQSAVDDNTRSDLDSLADILQTVISSDVLRRTIHETLLANSVLKSGCDQMLFGTCVLSTQLTYVDTRVDGPSTTNLTLVTNGLASTTRIENIGIQLRVDGQIAGLAFQRTGWINFESIDVSTIFDLGISSGGPRVTVRSGSTTTTVGDISTDFPGLDGAALSLVVQVANGLLRDYVAWRLQAYVVDSLDSVIDQVMAGLGVNNLGQRFDVARLDAGTPITLQFGSEFSSVSTDPSRMLFGMGTRFTAPAAHARPTLGAPLDALTPLLDVTGSEPIGIAIYEGVVGQALHALWKAGYFDATLDGSSNPSLGIPEGVVVTLATQLPPVAEIVGDRILLSLGGISAKLSYPALISTPVPMTLGVRASMAVHLVGNNLTFDGLTLDEMHVSIDAPDLEAWMRTLLEAAVPSMLEYMVSNGLRNSLPALPMPSFGLPASLADYGLPSGAVLGITDPTLEVAAPHFVLRGAAGIH